MLSSSAPALRPPCWCGTAGITGDTNTVQSYTGQGLSSDLSVYVDLPGEHPLAQSTRNKIPQK